jgi:hypothetical protein
VPFDFGMFGLGGGTANEPTVHGLVTGLDLTEREFANSGRGHLEDLAVVTITKVDAREDGQTPWRNLSGWPAATSRATQFAVHVEVAALTYSCLLHGGESAETLLGIPTVGDPNQVPGPKCPPRAYRPCCHCGAARTNRSRHFRLSGRTRRSLRIARLLWGSEARCVRHGQQLSALS